MSLLPPLLLSILKHALPGMQQWALNGGFSFFSPSGGEIMGSDLDAAAPEPFLDSCISWLSLLFFLFSLPLRNLKSSNPLHP